MNELISNIKIDNKSNNVLILGDTNYFSDEKSKEVEIISLSKVPCMRWLNIDDFVKGDKKPLYYKYNLIIIEQKYLELLNSIKYYFSDEDFKLIIILDKDYKVEYNDDIIKLLKDTLFESCVNELNSNIIIEVAR